jgi:2'-5' RNA ligase
VLYALQIRNACQALQENHSTLTEIARRGIFFHVAGVDHFYGRVVYAKVKPNAGLDEFVTRVRGTLTDAGVEIREGHDYLPHVTVLKLSMDRAFKFDRLPPFAYQNFKDMEFGVQRVESIDLCAMTHERDEDGFYVSPLHLDVIS